MNWSRHEREVLSSLGYDPHPGSGSGWKHREDGSNDWSMAQLKSTRGKSIRIIKEDLDTLIFNADIARLVPVFMICFVNDRESDEIFIMVRPKDIPKMLEVFNEREN